MRFPHYPQLEFSDCGPSCLRAILKFHGKNCDLSYLRELTQVTRSGVSMRDLQRAAQELGLDNVAVKATLNGLKEKVVLPCILHWEQSHFVVLYQIKDGSYYISDPGFGKIKLTEAEFGKMWFGAEEMGTLLMVRPGQDFKQRLLPYTEQKEINTRLKSFLKAHILNQRRNLLFLALLIALSSFIVYLLPKSMQTMIDEGIKLKQTALLLPILLFQLALFTGQALCEWLRNSVRLRLSSEVSIKLSADLLTKVITLPISFFDNRLQSDILGKIDEQDKIEKFLSNQLIQSLFSTILLIVLGTELFIFNPQIGLLFVTLSLLSVGWIMLFYNARRSIDYYSFKLISENRNHLLEMVAGMLAIKINNSQEMKINQWKKIHAKLYQIKTKSLRLESSQNMGAGYINQFKNLAITVLCSFWVIQGKMTFGQMLSTGYIVGVLAQPIDSLFGFIRGFQEAKNAYDRVDEIHKKEEESQASALNAFSSQHNIVLRDAAFKYNGGSSPLVINNLSMVIPHGKVTAIVGASGSGKTTLMKLLLRFYPLYKGSLSLGPHGFEEMNHQQWRDRIGVVMQDGYIFSGTIGDNISMMDGNWDLARVEEAARIACISDFVHSLPLRFDTKIGNAGADLSGGQRQRILIARAVYKNPDFIFFDEATSSLDANNENRIMHNLEKFFENKTAVVIAHRLSTVKNADQILVMDQGNVVECGSHQELTRAKGHYYELVKNQLELGS